MTALIQTLMPYGILVSHALFIFLLLALIFRKSWGKDIVHTVGKHAVVLGFVLAILLVSGSLFYSNVVGFEPCVLCWWQRVGLYPQLALFGVALWRRKTDVFQYSIPLVLFSTLISLYHQYVYLGGHSLLPCTALGGACSKIYVMAFGYITIPMMSLTASLFFLLLAWAHKIHENRHA